MFIASSSQKDMIFGIDNEPVNMNEFILSLKMNDSLKENPKLVFINSNYNSCIHMEKNFLVGFASPRSCDRKETYDDKLAEPDYRYISVLADVIKTNKQMEILDILKKVNEQLMKKKYGNETVGEEIASCFITKLEKNFYFTEF